MPGTEEDAALENRARRAASRIKLKARKSRWRRGSIDNYSGFQIIDPAKNFVVAGERFDLTAADVIQYCSDASPEPPVDVAYPSGETREVTVLFCDIVGPPLTERLLGAEEMRDLVSFF